MRRIANLVLAFSLLVGLPHVASAAQNGCVEQDILFAKMQKAAIYHSHLILEGSERKEMNEIITALTGDERQWSIIVIVRHKDDSGAVLVGNDGDICSMFNISKSDFRILMKTIRGVNI